MGLTAVLLVVAGALLGAVGFLFLLRVYAIRSRELAQQVRGLEPPADDPEFGPFGLATPPEKRYEVAMSRLEALRAEAAQAGIKLGDKPPDASAQPAFFYSKLLENGQWKPSVKFSPAPPASSFRTTNPGTCGRPVLTSVGDGLHGETDTKIEMVGASDLRKLGPALLSPRAARSPLAPRLFAHTPASAATPAWQTPSTSFADAPSMYGSPSFR